MPDARRKDRSRGGATHGSVSQKGLIRSKLDSINKRELRVAGPIHRVGNGLALLIPVAEARKAGLGAGDPVDAVIHSGVPDAFGLLRDLPYRPFDRHAEGLWRERV